MPLGSAVLACVAGVAGARGTLLQTHECQMPDWRRGATGASGHNSSAEPCALHLSLWLLPSQINWERNRSKSSCCICFHVGWCSSSPPAWEDGLHIVCICWWFKKVFQAFPVPLGPASTCTHLHPSYPHQCITILYFLPGTLLPSLYSSPLVFLLQSNPSAKFIQTLF